MSIYGIQGLLGQNPQFNTSQVPPPGGSRGEPGAGTPKAILASRIISCYLPMFPESLIMSRFLKGFESDQREYNKYKAGLSL